MNKYIIPFCDINKNSIKLLTIMANNRSDCQEKIINNIIDSYNIEDTTSNYREFIDFIDSEYDLLIGNITDIEEL